MVPGAAIHPSKDVAWTRLAAWYCGRSAMAGLAVTVSPLPGVSLWISASRAGPGTGVAVSWVSKESGASSANWRASEVSALCGPSSPVAPTVRWKEKATPP